MFNHILMKFGAALCLVVTACSPSSPETESYFEPNSNKSDTGSSAEAVAQSDEGEPVSLDPLMRLASSPPFSFDMEMLNRDNCSEQVHAGTSYFFCDPTPLQPCPFSLVNQCKFETEYAGDKLRSVSFEYEPGDLDRDRFIQDTTAKFGPPRQQTKEGGSVGIDQTMSTWKWRIRTLEIELFEISGRNFSGEDYHDTSIDFRDTSIPSAMESISKRRAE